MFLTYKRLIIEIPELIKLLPPDKSNSQLSNWEIIDNKLYVSNPMNLDSSEIFANWVNVKLSLSVNPALNYHKKDQSSDYYESSMIVFIINKGHVVNKYIRIVPKAKESNYNLYSDNLISFNEKPFTVSLHENFKLFLKEEYEKFEETPTLLLIKKLVTSIKEEHFNNTSKPSFDFFQNGNTMTDLLIDELSITVGSNFIFLYPNNNNLNKKYQELLHLYFLNISDLIDNSDNIDLKNHKYFYKPYKLDVEFIKWAVQNLKWFILSPTFHTNFVISKQIISIEKVRDVFFEYEIENITIDPYEFLTKDEIQLNFRKINLKYNFEEKTFNYCSTNKNLLFDFLLSNTEDINSDLFNKIEYDNDINQLTFKKEQEYVNADSDYDDEPNSRDWLKDASGSDDPETMNDVYWNLD